MPDKDKLKSLIKTRIITKKPKCAHHWVLQGDKGVPLRGRQAIKFPDCIGRRSKCKLCELEKILPERVY